MKHRPTLLSWFAFAASLLLAGCAGKTTTTTVTDNTFTITRHAGSGVDHDVDKLKAQVRAEAEQFCAVRGKQLKVISLDSDKPLYLTGYASASITFKALNANDPELLMTSAPMTGVSGQPGGYAPPPAAYQNPGMSGDLYTQLTKLDELRKKGILTDDEFQAEKKKILAKSQ